MRTATNDQAPAGTWLRALRVYLGFILLTNLAWELLQLPLYVIWSQGSMADMAFAVAHCTGGDVLIATGALVLSLLAVGDWRWPQQSFAAVAALAVALGVLYTIFSEWLNIVVRQSWQYSEWMPVVPVLGTGLSPLAQWLVLPLLCLWLARRRTSSTAGP